MKNKIITIIGGDGAMATLFKQLWLSQQVIIQTIDKHNWDKANEYLSKSNAVIICVPINITNQIINQVSKLISHECILADFTSIKVSPMLEMLKCHSGPVVGLHPMFGPTINNTKNQIIAVCNGRLPEQYQWLINSLNQLGFTLKYLTPEEHDNAMNFIQGIEHFITFSLGTFLYQKSQHPNQLMELASPIYLAKLLLMGRIFDQDSQLYADIIMADKARLNLIEEFSLWLNQWINKLKTGNKKEFIEEFDKASSWMGEFTQYAQKISDEFLNIKLDK